MTKSIYNRCPICGLTGFAHSETCSAPTLMGKRLSDDPGLAEMNRMEYLMSKAPCIARLDDLADWSEGKD